MFIKIAVIVVLLEFQILKIGGITHFTESARPSSHWNGTSDTESNAVKELLYRLIPDRAAEFNVTVDYSFDNKDAFMIWTENDKVHIIGNKGYSAAAGLYHYLKVYCGCHISWSGNQLNIPDVLPKLDDSLKITFHDKYRYYQNVCTSSYSFVWWDWKRWEKEIDWMALNGMNLALAFTAQEAIYYQVFKGMNFTDHDIEVFFTGPAFLAWNRMGNMQAWVGPLSENWHKNQISLQHKILKRMRSFGMTPVLPAFSGRVNPAFKRNFPHADTTVLNKTWGHFQPPFGFVTFLEPTDPLFEEIGVDFLNKYIEEFGTNHIYSADLFNEMPPPSNDPSYLQSCAKAMYKMLTAIDPEAIWLTQGWMFYSDPETWQDRQSRAFLRAIPQGKMIILDLQSELYPQYNRLKSYYGQPFIWCMLHNYGGVKGLYGSLQNINELPFEGRTFNGSTMIGTGLTPEGIETNDIVYELMNEMAWRIQPVDLDKWIENYALRRYGVNSSEVVFAMQYLKKSVYNATVPYRNHGKYILIRRPSLKLKPYIWYNPVDVFDAWSLFLNASENHKLKQSKLFQHDLVDLTRQCLQLSMTTMYSKVVASFRERKIVDYLKNARAVLNLFDEMEEILASNEHFLLGRWLESAKKLGITPLEKIQYEYNARNQITLWGPAGELVDYANKQWAGLMSQYYKKRWKLFLETLLNCLINGWPFNQTDFNEQVYRQIEYEFDLGTETYPVQPSGEPVEISKKLFLKYENILSNL
ncbi:alpha-N-acetylglucosaminidase isoform X1 [Parasteatoda tepidariorum]|uniref:alpha-N-acetylglucosaminidase isoform X1 n=2 Tax=Parasteatoda tepidariorum TaxID=114398 RepID=UPI001C7227FD|nr:alpha-N-acetylglucosaminidase isoform X2 [Parasteatoda tepidariorum]